MHFHSLRLRCLVPFVALAVFSATGLKAESTAEGIAFFEKSIRPVLVQHCYECHSAAAEAKGKQKAGLLLDTKQGLLAGGESGPAIIPGSAEKSLLIRALKYDAYEMPPTGKLPAAVIADFEKWVEMGAPDPREATSAPKPRRAEFRITDEDRRHWSFQSIKSPPLPQVRNADWCRDDFDRFVLAKLESAELKPGSDADKYTLLRRVTFALTGLPPTPEEIDAFLSDREDNAYEKVVERLLASRDFGVQWGRYWLDGVRYADSIDKSGEYRRWVVRAINEDLPYDQFIKLQIAGDLIPAEESVPRDRVMAKGTSFDGVTATGMMALAVWEQVGRDLAVAEIVDSQIDLIGRQLLGLTLACARCHDHKFDPISTQDYYALAGVLFSSHIATGKLIADARLGTDLVEVPLLNAEQEETNRKLDKKISELEKKIATISKKIPQAARLAEIDPLLKDAEAQLAKATSSATKKSLTEQIEKLKTEQKKLVADQEKESWELNPPELQEIAEVRKQIAEQKKRKIVPKLAVGITEGGVPGSNREKIGDAPIYLRGEYQREGAIVPRRFPTILAGESQTSLGERTSQSGRRELADWIASADNPLTSRVMVNRIWQQLIGRGLVRSPDNFGRLGEAPTHPELLDHLSQRFMSSGWSVKKMIRDIVLSSTFRQTSLVESELAVRDPENRLLSHMNRSRLTYEELRDSLLYLSNERREAEGDQASKGEVMRRTMFESQDRRKTDVTAAMFDGPDTKAIVPTRAETTTAPQALFLMNNSLVLDTAKKLAARVTKNSSLTDDRERLDYVWRLTYGRPIDADEAKTALEFLGKHSWERFIQALLGTNEFSYVD